MHPDQAQNTLSGIQGLKATAVAVIYVPAPTSSRKTTKYKWNNIAKIQQKTCIVKTVIRLSTVLTWTHFFGKHFHCQKSIPNCVWKHCFHTGKLCKALTTCDDIVSLGQPISVTQSQQSNKQINKWKMRHMSNQLQVYIKPRLDVIIQI